MTYLIMAGQAAGALIAIFSLLGMFIKYVVVKPIKAYIEQMTYPIQPTSNGGKALPDLINSVDDLKTMLNKHLEEHDTPK
jgi:hypothetical protein